MICQFQRRPGSVRLAAHLRVPRPERHLAQPIRAGGRRIRAPSVHLHDHRPSGPHPRANHELPLEAPVHPSASALFERFATAPDIVRLSARSVSSTDHISWLVLPFGAFGPPLADLVTSVIPALRGNPNIRDQWQCRFITPAQEPGDLLRHKSLKITASEARASGSVGADDCAGLGPSRPAGSGLAKVTSTVSPPWGRAWIVREPSWAATIAWTIDSPSPEPSPWPVRSGASRSNGWVSRPTAPASTTGPVLVTDRSATPPRRPVVTSIRPGFELYARALSTRFAMSRSTRRGSPVIGAGARTERRSIERPRAWDSRESRTCSARIARSNGSRLVRPACPRVSVSSASIRRCCCAPDASTRSCAAP